MSDDHKMLGPTLAAALPPALAAAAAERRGRGAWPVRDLAARLLSAVARGA